MLYRYSTITAITAHLETILREHGEERKDKTWDRTVKEVMFPEQFCITNHLTDTSVWIRRPGVKEQIEKEWDMWKSSVTTLVYPQLKLDMETRRAVVTLPFSCKTLMAFYVRHPGLHVYSFWRSIEKTKLPADLIIFDRIVRMVETWVMEWLCDSPPLVVQSCIQIGSYHEALDEKS